ncbi:MAG: myxococcus cysteine-rich repeat containing protein [Candidatus Binatia bacterium]
MRLGKLTVLALFVLAVARTAMAVVYDGSTSPPGRASADAVISSQPASAAGRFPLIPTTSTRRALGHPDYVPDAGGSGGEFNGTGAYALGNGGRLELWFVDNVITNSATAAADLAIFERGVDEAFFVAVCGLPTRPRAGPARGAVPADRGSARFAGARTPVNDAAQVDLDAEFALGYAAGALRFDAVQLTDTTAQGRAAATAKPDIDAAGAIASAGIACGDGLVEGDEECDDAGVADGDGCSATCQVEICWTCAAGIPRCTIASGSLCDDGEPCTQNDVCVGLTCTGGPPPNCDDANVYRRQLRQRIRCAHAANTAACDDGSTCSTGDHCVLPGERVGTASERSGCRLALPRHHSAAHRQPLRRQQGQRHLGVAGGHGRRWSRSAIWLVAVPAGSFELCASTAPGARRSAPAAWPPTRAELRACACWRAQGVNRFIFRNPSAPSGLRQVFLKSGADARAKVLAKGRGAAIRLPDDLTMTLPVRAELRDTNSSECWEDVYGATDTIRNDADRFKAKH